jgi:AraC-like DNA-binding protein
MEKIMEPTTNPGKTKMVGKRPSQYARLLYRIIEENLSNDSLAEFYASYALGVKRDDLLAEEALFRKPFIDEKYWVNLLLLGLREEIMGPRLPMIMAPYHKVETAGAVAAMMMTAPSIRGLIEPMCRYQPALDPTLIMGNEPVDGGIRIIAHYDGIEGDVAQCFLYAGLHMMEDAMIRMAIWSGEPAPIITVNAPMPAYHQDVRNLFHSRVYWDGDPKRQGSGWMIDIPNELLDVPNYMSQPAIHQESAASIDLIIKRRAELVAASREEGQVGGPQTELVRSTLSTALTLLSQAQVADLVRCEPRTLQKRLQREGSSWSELVTNEFMKRAEPAVLREESSKALAKRMGMTESNFYRKFQKLYGVTPKQWLLSQKAGGETTLESVAAAASKMRR